MSRLVAFKPIFPSPFGYANFGEENRELNKQLIKDINYDKSIDDGKDRSFKHNDSSWQSYPTMETKYDSFEKLREQIQYAIKPIMKHSGFEQKVVDNCKVENLWANLIFDAGGYSTPHFHGSGRTLWSGVYYPHGLKENNNLDEFKEEEWIQLGFGRGDGLLILYDPAKLVKAQVYKPFETGEYYGQEISVIPRETLLVLFPNWMSHMVTPLTKKDNRYSISFACNYNYD
tara:strand:- start:127 stop:816 length:690 start_codon:yes stop_codon:yes gene_type:complete